MAAVPTVAVCVPTWRPVPAHLRAVVASALAQDEPVEVVVRDDGSPGHPVTDALHGLAGADRVEVVRGEARLGMVGSWNAAVRASEAPIVVLPGQDDVLAPDLATAHRQALEAVPEAVLCASTAVLVDAAGRPLRGRAGPGWPARGALAEGAPEAVLDQRALVEACLVRGNLVGAPAQVSFRRDAFEACGGFSAAYEHAADLDLWLRLVRAGPVVLLARPRAVRRVHEAAATGEHRRSGAAARDRDRLLADHGHGLDRAVASRARWARARWAMGDAARAARRGAPAGAARHLAAAGSHLATAGRRSAGGVARAPSGGSGHEG